MDKKYLHFKPTYESPCIDFQNYYDISNSDLNIWDLQTFKLQNSYSKVTQGFSIKLRVFNSNLLLIADNDKIKLFSLKEGKIIQTYNVQQLIQEIETDSNVVVCSVSGQDINQKKIYKWKVQKDKFIFIGSIVVGFPEQIQPEDIFQLNIFKSGKIYYFKKLFQQVYEIKIEEKEVKSNKIPKKTTAILELANTKNFAVACQGKININDPIKGAFYGNIECQEEIYHTIVEYEQQNMLITSSNKGVKGWMLQSKSQPKLFAKSHLLSIQKLVVHENRLIGLGSNKTKTIAVWNMQTYQIIKIQKISKQQLQKIVKLNEKQICLVIKIFDQTQQSLSFHHKLEIVDITNDSVIASKQVKKSIFQIEVNSLIAFDAQTIKFICFSDSTQKPKAYLFTWRPFTKQQKKQLTKIQMSRSAITKLYKFDRIICANPPKQNKSEGFSLFKTQTKTSVLLYNHSLKKLAQIGIQGLFQNIELSEDNKLFCVGKQKIIVMKLIGSNYEIQNQSQLCIRSLNFINSLILVKSLSGDTVLYDQNFELILKTEQQSNQPIMKIIKVNVHEFVVIYKNNNTMELWNCQTETIKKNKFEFEILDAQLMQESRLYVLQSTRIQIFDVNSLFK